MYDYDPKRPSPFISYIDMKNVFGRAMSEDLPQEYFKWQKNIDEFDITSMKKV